MTDFDTRLRTKLEHLDAAVPAAPVPAILAARPRRRSWTRRLVPLLAAAALLIGGGAVAAERLLYPDNPEPQLEAALGAIWAGQDCLTEDQARTSVQGALDELSYGDWEIVDRPGVGQGTGCTFPMVLASEHTVLLFPGAGAELSNAFEALGDEMLARCLNRADAMALVSSVLVSHGVTEFDILADPWGPQGGPLDKIDAYEAHVAAGCFVYVGMGWNENGKPQYYLWGPWP